ncbi:acyl-CoA desaturase [Thioalkalivibrio sulfidiphilus]|uniref:acyl-CoA desaturase n=1 Tax=Thioalkalivibrio sulfidiphilus TaxID=1033854 RepID=UPI000362B614|nr:fatty acid desaturase [Thioalkalivibrio sulfidiphilus]
MSSPESRNTRPRLLWTTTLMFSLTALVALIAVPWYGIAHGYSLSAWIAFGAFMVLGSMSITAGYHRLWAHRSYEAHPVIRVALALWGAMTLQNSILIWASGHRTHHRHVDDNERDPYSAGRGFWFSHIGWMLRDYPSGQSDFSNAPDLLRDPIVMWQHRYYLPIALGMNIIPPVLLGLVFGNVLEMLLLAGFLRLVLAHHFTFFINSLAHVWGKRPYTEENSARDNGFLALLTFGEGYHNYHHLFQYDYRNGIRWWQFDPTKWLIATLSWLGLARNLKRASKFKIYQAVLATEFRKAREQLARDDSSLEKWRGVLEQEYQHFLSVLEQWKTHKAHLYEQTRHKIAAHWEHAAMRTRMREFEYMLKMQRKRLALLKVQFS